MVKEQKQASLEKLRVSLGAGKIKCYEVIPHSEIPSYKIGGLRELGKSDVGQWLDNRSSITESQ